MIEPVVQCVSGTAWLVQEVCDRVRRVVDSVLIDRDDENSVARARVLSEVPIISTDSVIQMHES
jgi:hypothetical protein